MLRRAAPTVSLALALAALAQGAGALQAERITPDAFERLTVGRTLTFRVEGEPYGAEEYLPGRRVIWQNVSGRCLRGYWTARGEDVCFTYEDRPDDRLCWIVERDAEGLTARVADEPFGLSLRFGPERPAPLECGPEPAT